MGKLSEDRVLIADDQPVIRELMKAVLESLGYSYRVAADGEEALQIMREHRDFVAVLSDVKMPGISGIELLQRIRDFDPTLQVVMITSARDLQTVRDCLRHGAHDYLTKPISPADVEQVLRRSIAQTKILRENERYRYHLEEMVEEQTRQIRHTHDIALLTLAKLAESRDKETGHHLDRISAYSELLANCLRQSPYEGQITDTFLLQLSRSSALHDIGKVGIPDSILLKAGPLNHDEFQIMKRHTTIGGDTLRSVIDQTEHHDFLQMAMEIAYSHHEKWDGSGYPEGTVGDHISLSARIVALVDAYDAITSRRPYKEALSHEEALRRVEKDSGIHFDPVLVDTFLSNHDEFNTIRRSLAEESAMRLELPARASALRVQG